MAQYVALLRGINVGGKNVIKMADLKPAFAELGLADVATYIQSGNVLFAAEGEPPDSIAERIERQLSARFGYAARIVLRSQTEMHASVGDAPARFGAQPDAYRYDALFVRAPVTAADVMRELKTREGVDQAFEGEGICYFARLTSRATQSQLSRIVGTPIYQHLTIRNWAVTCKLADLLDTRAAAQSGG